MADREDFVQEVCSGADNPSPGPIHISETLSCVQANKRLQKHHNAEANINCLMWKQDWKLKTSLFVWGPEGFWDLCWAHLARGLFAPDLATDPGRLDWLTLHLGVCPARQFEMTITQSSCHYCYSWTASPSGILCVHPRNKWFWSPNVGRYILQAIVIFALSLNFDLVIWKAEQWWTKSTDSDILIAHSDGIAHHSKTDSWLLGLVHDSAGNEPSTSFLSGAKICSAHKMLETMNSFLSLCNVIQLSVHSRTPPPLEMMWFLSSSGNFKQLLILEFFFEIFFLKFFFHRKFFYLQKSVSHFHFLCISGCFILSWVLKFFPPNFFFNELWMKQGMTQCYQAFWFV